MAQKFYVGDYGGPLSVNVFAADGVTPVLPISATIDIIDMVTGTQVVDDGLCLVSSGLASYVIPSGSAATATAGRYVGFITVLLEVGNQGTEELYFNVYGKTSHLILERWRTKVQDSAPSEDHIDDDNAREWIDQAIDMLNQHYSTGYSSVLGSLSPVPTSNDIEFVSSVASLMARTAWWAGKGTWRDGEISFSGTPLEDEWAKLGERLDLITNQGWAEDWFGDTASADMYNRDRVYYDGRKYDSPAYWRRHSTDPEPNTDIPV